MYRDEIIAEVIVPFEGLNFLGIVLVQLAGVVGIFLLTLSRDVDELAPRCQGEAQ